MLATWVFVVARLTNNSRADLAVGQSLRDQAEHLAFAVAERVEAGRSAGASGGCWTKYSLDDAPQDRR